VLLLYALAFGAELEIATDRTYELFTILAYLAEYDEFRADCRVRD
jgi:hypothetical protein